MAYDPTADTIRERILQNIQETLESIQGGSTYRHSVVKVDRFMGNMMQFASFPSIAIVPGTTRTTDQRLAIREHTLPVTLLLMLDSQGWKREMEFFLADVWVALSADHTRGGVALTTRGTAEDIQDSEPSSPLSGGQLDIEVLYRTLYSDPGSAI